MVWRTDREPHPANRRLLEFLGVRVEVTTVRARTRTTERTHSRNGGFSVSELKRREREAVDASPVTTRCGFDGCGWSFDGTFAEGRERAAAHRAEAHAGASATSRRIAENEQRRRAEAAASERRSQLERMDAGEPQPPAARADGSWSRQPVARETVIEALREAARELGHTPTGSEWRRLKRRPSGTAMYRLFGTWGAACEAAGLELSHQPPRVWSRGEMLDAIRAFAAQNGRPPKASEWKNADLEHPTVDALAREFGRFARALEAAGFEAAKGGRPKMSEREPTGRETAKPSGPSPAPDDALTSPAAVPHVPREPVAAEPASRSNTTIDVRILADGAGWVDACEREAERLDQRAAAFRKLADALRELKETAA